MELEESQEVQQAYKSAYEDSKAEAETLVEVLKSLTANVHELQMQLLQLAMEQATTLPLPIEMLDADPNLAMRAAAATLGGAERTTAAEEENEERGVQVDEIPSSISYSRRGIDRKTSKDRSSRSGGHERLLVSGRISRGSARSSTPTSMATTPLTALLSRAHQRAPRTSPPSSSSMRSKHHEEVHEEGTRGGRSGTSHATTFPSIHICRRQRLCVVLSFHHLCCSFSWSRRKRR